MENGHIAVVASIMVLVHGGVDVSAYSSTKYALHSYINCLRQ
jgi:short-subunit dehydrogenase